MDLTPYVDSLRRELATAAAAGGDEARALAERLTAPLESAVRLALLDALSAATAEITRGLAPGSLGLRLPEQLKSRVEEAASRAGVSINAWLVRAAATAVETEGGRRVPPRAPHGSQRYSGWVR